LGVWNCRERKKLLYTNKNLKSTYGGEWNPRKHNIELPVVRINQVLQKEGIGTKILIGWS
jgi:hypothetical protein